jgi:histidyl-tRNA synthetase
MICNSNKFLKTGSFYNKMEVETAKGVRDFGPEEKILRNYITTTITKVFELYGFSPIETPIIERMETLAAKFAAGEGSDALNEIFKLTDQGKRNLGLRFDLTVPLARYIAMNPTIKMPFKRYELGRVYRDGPIKLGRYREFSQCDADIVGCKSVKAEMELILLALDVFKKLSLDAYINVNSRKLLFGILDLFNLDNESKIKAIIAIDKINKLDMAAVEKELYELGISKADVKKLTDIMDTRGSNTEILEKIEKLIKTEEGKAGIAELRELFDILGNNSSIKLNLALARGLGYYTGIVFEAFLKESKIKSSIAGGGRYDNLIALYLGTKRDYPAAGISFGLEPITEYFKLKKEKLDQTLTKVFVIPINEFNSALAVVQKLRANGISAEIDLLDKGISKNLEYVNSKGIKFAAFIGEHEVKAGKIKLKDMNSGEEELITVEETIIKIKS